MLSAIRFRLTPAVATVVVALGVSGAQRDTSAAPAAPVFAAPWAIIAHGPLLRTPVVIASWEENLQFMLAISRDVPATPAKLSGRKPVELAMFWGPEWKHLASSPEAVARLRPEQANQRVRLYPAHGDLPAVVIVNPYIAPVFAPGAAARVVSAEGLAVLARHGVPVRTPTR